MLTFPSAPNYVWHLPQGHWPGFGESRKSTVFSRGRTQLTDFFQISQNPPRTLLVHDVIHIPRSPFSIWDFYFDICEWHILPARAWTPALMLHLTNPCAKRKVLSLTKPKGKIYKTKCLSHYITFHWSLSDNKSPLLIRTLLIILAVLAMLWIGSIISLIFCSLCLFSRFFGTVLRAPNYGWYHIPFYVSKLFKFSGKV